KIQAIAVNQTGGPEVLRLEERELGDPGPGQVRIRIRAAGVNYIDVYFRTGLYPRPLPFVAGLEGSGEIESLAADVRGLAPGARARRRCGPRDPLQRARVRTRGARVDARARRRRRLRLGREDHVRG